LDSTTSAELDPSRVILDDVGVSSSQSDAVVSPVRVVPAVDGVELLFMAAVGAASLSLRVALDAIAGVTGRPRQAPVDLSRAAFAGLARGLVGLRSIARTADRGLRAGERATSVAFNALPDVVRAPVDHRVAALRERDRARDRELAGAEVLAEDLVTALVPRIASGVLDQLDLTSLVKERVDVNDIVRGVDLDAIVKRIDLDAIAARLDVAAIVDRLDLAGLAQTVIEEIDLPEVIRRSTGVVASETMRGVRMQGIDGDRAIAGLVDKLLGRRRPRRTETDAVAPMLGSPDERGGST
jgi:hypothetical protein